MTLGKDFSGAVPPYEILDAAARRFFALIRLQRSLPGANSQGGGSQPKTPMTESFETPYCSTCEARLQSVLNELAEGNLETVASSKACNFYKKGEIIFREGKHQIVRFAKAGDVLGYRSLMSGDLYAVSAAALEDSIVCRIPQETFFQMFHTDEAFSVRVIQVLSGELQRAEEQMLKLAQKPVRARLAETLLILKEVYGTENGDNPPLNVTLSREELASVVGTATETLVRALADLKREHLIATEKKKIRIVDLPGLVHACNLHRTYRCC